MRPIEGLDRGAADHPQRPALVFGEQVLTYSQVRDLSCRIAQRLHARGYGVGSHGAVLTRNDAVGFVCALGMMRAGMTWLPVNATDSVAQIGVILDRLDARVLFVNSDFAGALTDLREAAPRIAEIMVYDRDLDRWLGDASSADVSVGDDPDAIAAIFSTSGTTGLPRGVMHSNRGLMAFVNAFGTLVPHHGTVPVYLAAAPLTHVSGRIVLALMQQGATTVVLKRAEPLAILEALAEHRVTITFLPPTAIYDLLKQPDLARWRERLPAFKYLYYGSAPMRLEVLKQALATLGPVMSQGYGQTEAPMLMTAMSPEEHFVDGQLAPDERLSSVGRPTQFVQLAVMDDDVLEVPRGEVGEVCVRGKFVATGYYKDLAATAEVSRGGWHHTGDLGYLDAEGYLHLVDRKKDMIISGGFNVYSAEVERVIAGLPEVAEVAVVGVPDERWGETVKAVIVPRPGQTITEAEVIAICKQRLGSVKAPKSVDLWEWLPRNPAGKILKREIRDRYVKA